MLNRDVIVETVGKTFADKVDEAIIHVSQDLSFTRREMVEELGCANFIAAARLAKVLRRLKIHTVGQLYRTDPVSLYRAKGVGDAAIFVAMCILDAKEFNVMKWWDHASAREKQKKLSRAKRNKQTV